MRLVFLIFLLIFSSLSFISSQNTISEIDSNGNQIIILTIDEVRDIDYKLDILDKLLNSVSDLDSAFVQLIRDKDNTIELQNDKISKFEELNNIKSEQIENLNEQIKNYKYKEITYLEELENNKKEINLHIEEIRNQKNKRLLQGIGSGIIISGLFTLLIVN